jgi:hypothetical protein
MYLVEQGDSGGAVVTEIDGNYTHIAAAGCELGYTLSHELRYVTGPGHRAVATFRLVNFNGRNEEHLN